MNGELRPLIAPEAERLAREAFEALRSVALDQPGVSYHFAAGPGWEGVPAKLRAMWTDACLATLCDLTKPASRDALVRLCIAREMEKWDAEMFHLTDDRRSRWHSTHLDTVRAYWHALRDDPDALAPAALAVAATRTGATA